MLRMRNIARGFALTFLASVYLIFRTSNRKLSHHIWTVRANYMRLYIKMNLYYHENIIAEEIFLNWNSSSKENSIKINFLL
jgi:hypothetical protein